MSTTIKAGWLKDKQGNKFAPKTLSSQVITTEGLSLEDKITEDLNTLDIELKNHTHEISEVENLQTTLDDKVSVSTTINGKPLASDITLTASDVNAYTKTEIDEMEFITIEDIDAICGTTSIQMASEVTF